MGRSVSRWIVPVFFVAATFSWAPAVAQEHTETVRYSRGLAPGCPAGWDVGLYAPTKGSGGACFRLSGTETTIHVRLVDDTGMRVYASYGFLRTGQSGRTYPFCDEVTVPVPPGQDFFGVFVTGGLDTGCAGGTVGTLTATFQYQPGGGPPSDVERDCLEAVPEQVGVSGMTDEGRSVDFDVLVLVDAGLTLDQAASLLAPAARAYSPLGIALHLTYEQHAFSSLDLESLISEARDHVGGTRPAGVDAVYALVNQEIPDAAGEADCIGGVRYPERAFAVGEYDTGFSLGPVTWRNRTFEVTWKNMTAKIFAHEIAHLVGHRTLLA